MSRSGTNARRVAILTHVGALSGAELALWRLVRQLDSHRYHPVVVTFADGPLVERLRRDGIETVVVPLAPEIAAARRGKLLNVELFQKGAAFITFGRELVTVLRDLRVDIVHTHSLKSDLIGAALVPPFLRRPLVWHVHDRISDDYLPSWVVRSFRLLARRVPRHVVVNSYATLRTLVPLPRGWTVAYPGLATADFLTDVLDRSDIQRQGRPVVGLLGRLGPTKGQDLFLRAAAEVARTHPDAKYRIIGTTMFGEHEYEQSLHQLSARLGLDERVEFVGFVQDPAAALAELTVFVHASPVPEPFGQVIVEAMAAGVPAVVTDAGGASEIVRDGDELIARLAAPGDVAELAAGIINVLDDPTGALEMSERAFNSVRRRFAIGDTAEAVMAAWDIVLGDRAAGSSQQI